MVELNDVADGLEDRMKVISGLQVSSEWQDSPNPPAAIALPQTLRQTTFSSRFTWTMRVLVIVSIAGGIGRAARALNPYMQPSGDRSILEAIEGDTTLDGLVEDIDTAAAVWENIGFHEVNSVAYWGAHLNNLEIYIKD